MKHIDESINLDKIELGEGNYLHLTFSDGEVVRLGFDEHGRQRARRMLMSNEFNISSEMKNEFIKTFGFTNADIGLSEDIDDIDLDYESDFDDNSVYPGTKFIEDGKEWIFTVGYDQIYLDFDHWQIWEARNVDSDELAFFIVDPDTGFIDWGPVETHEEASEFLYSKQDDWMDDDAEELEAIYNDNDLNTAAELLINYDDIV